MARFLCKNTVHPRVCGEQDVKGTLDRVSNGSSPRVRGTEVDYLSDLMDNRFIPACAGNRPVCGAAQTMISVHPRVCGEQKSDAHQQHADHGSSPRVRGTDGPPLTDDDIERFIPACAGNSIVGALSTKPATVHPRVCGEQVPPWALKHRSIGSSPRVRGTGRISPISTRRSRFIPACAGNSAFEAPPLLPHTVHPRVCGEQKRSNISSF